MRLLIFAVGLGSAVLTTGRGAVLLLFLASAYALYSLDLIRGRGVAIALALFAAVFLGIALLVNKGADAGDSSAQVVWNLEVYLLGSVAAFNHFVAWVLIRSPVALSYPTHSVVDCPLHRRGPAQATL